ncbi:MAG: hypothetical protein SGBAC_000720 [Bacillariaceae sp.]
MIFPATFLCLALLSVVGGFQLFPRYLAKGLGALCDSTPTRSTRLFSTESEENDDDRIDLSLDDRLYRIRLPRAPGIEWGTDLSFSFVYVRELDPVGPASMSGRVSKGDQLCELTPVEAEGKAVNLLGASFDTTMGAFAGLTKNITEVDLVFFKGTKDELKEACTGDEGAANSDIITVTVIQNKGAEDEKVVELQAKAGVNIRQLLVDNGINVYQSVTRFTNCKGKQLCGTCIVNVTNGLESTNWKSMDEASTLRDNPDSYRLSCISFAYGDVTVETLPPVEKYQWTR